MHIKTIIYSSDDKFFSVLKKLTVMHEAILIKDFPLDNTVLIHLASQLGDLSRTGVGEKRSNLENEIIHRISNVKSLNDPYGFEILSTTAKPFLLHTDCFFSAKRVKFVILHCWIPSKIGGDSLLSSVVEVINQLSDHSLKKLQTNLIYTPYGKTSILFNGINGYGIRYNQYEINKFAITLGVSYDNEVIALLDYLDDVVESVSRSLKLDRKDCLIVHNERCLHGRTKFPTCEHRLLKRIRVNAP